VWVGLEDPDARVALAALEASGAQEVLADPAVWVGLEAWAEQAGRAEPAPLLNGRLLVAPSGLEAHSGPPVAVSGPQAHSARVAPLAI
jgi:hypothetical protein